MATFNWTTDSVFELISLFEEKPELWDISSEHYKDKDKRQESWLEIAMAMNTDADTVQRKMRMLTSQYRRELFRTRPGSSKWFAFKKLSFLKSRQIAVFKNRPRPTCFVSAVQEREEFKIKEGDGQRTEKLALKDRISITKAKNSETREKDEYATYGELVAMKLKKIPNSYARSTAQFHINNILYKAEIGAYDKHQRKNKSFNSRENFRARSSTPRRDSNNDEDSQRSSPSVENHLKLEIEDSDE